VGGLGKHQETNTEGFAEDMCELVVRLGLDGGGGEKGGDAAPETVCASGHAVGLWCQRLFLMLVGGYGSVGKRGTRGRIHVREWIG